METIVLNKKTKIILWRRILLVAAAALIFIISLQLKFTYRYYTIDRDGNKTILGNSTNEFVILETEDDFLANISSDGHIVVDYTLENIVDKRIILTWKKDSEKNVKDIEECVKDNMVTIVYAYEMNYKGKTYIIPANKRDYIQDKLELKADNFKGIFINIDKELSDEDIENIIAG